MKSKTEVSSGGIVYRKDSGTVQILVIKDPKGNWTFPKGLVEKGEDNILTAQREIKEEAGMDNVNFRKDLGMVKYFYTFGNTLIRKTVHYFLFELKGKCKIIPQKEEGIQEAKFINLKSAQDIIGYKKTNGPILKKIEEFFKNQN